MFLLRKLASSNIFLFVVILIFLVGMVNLLVPSLTKVAIRTNTNVVATSEFPFWAFSRGEEDRDHFIVGELHTVSLSPKNITLMYFDCLLEVKLNGTLLFKTNGEGQCGSPNLVTLDYSHVSLKNPNTLEVHLRDEGWRYGLFMLPSWNDSVFRIFAVSLMVASSALLFYLGRLLKFKKSVITIVIVSFLLRVFYLGYTSFIVRQHDVDGHIDYIQYILRTWSLPDPGQCWECWQPPLYYVLTAIFHVPLTFLGLGNFMVGLQILSLVLYMVFLLFGLLILREVIRTGRLFFLASFLLVFWPSGIIHSARISNDVLYYCLSAAALYFLFRWQRNNSRTSFLLSAFFALLNILVKTAGLAVAATIMSVYILEKVEEKKLNRHTLIKCMTLCLFFGIGVMVNVWNTVVTKTQADLFVGNLSAHNSFLFVKNELANFLWFDTKTFLTYPFTSAWDDSFGRQYFWNFFLKTSLFGEFAYPKSIHAHVAYIISALLLMLLIFALYRYFSSTLREVREQKTLFIFPVFVILQAMAFRYMYSVAGAADFRYSLPLIIPFIYFLCGSISYLEKKNLPLLALSVIFGILLFGFLAIFFFSIPI